MVACTCREDFAAQANNRIVLQSAVLTADDAGGWIKTWADAFTVWAVIEPMAGREMFISSQLQSRVDARITIRYLADLSSTKDAAKYQVKFGDRLYNLKAVKNLADDMKTEGRSFQQLLCVEGEPA